MFPFHILTLELLAVNFDLQPHLFIQTQTNFITVFQDGLIGLFCNTFVIVVFVKGKNKTSFNLICLFRAVNNVINLLFFITNVFPLTIA